MVLGWAALALAWLAGVGVHLHQSALPPDAVGWAAAGVAALGWLSSRWWWPRGVSMAAMWRWALLAALSALTAWTWAHHLARERLAQTWSVTWHNREVWLTGQVDSMPQLQTWGMGMRVAVQRLEFVEPLGAAAPPGNRLPHRVSLSWAAPTQPGGPQVLPGQVWRWRVQLRTPGSLLNPGGFDGMLASFEQGVGARGKVVERSQRTNPAKAGVAPKAEPTGLKPGADAAHATLLRSPHAWDGHLIERQRTRWRERISAFFSSSRVAGLVIGLTVGEQGAITPQDWDAMRQTGTAHLAAISGLHITMMGWWVALMVSWGWRRSPRLMHWVAAPKAAAWAALAGAWIYALLSGWGLPAQRTVVMLAVVTLLRASGKRWPWGLILLAAAVVVTLWDPWALLQPGFWLSFMAVGLLMLGGASEQPAPQVSIATAARELTRTQVLATAGLAPLSLVFFQSVSVLGLAANLVCIPLFTLVITPLAMLGLLWQGFWRPLAPIVNVTLDALAALGQQPWALWQTAGVQAWAAWLALAAGAWMLLPVPWRVRLLAAPALLPLLWPNALSQAWPAPPVGHVRIMAADVGQGTAVLVQTARHHLLFDTGPAYGPDMDAGRRVLNALLRTAGVARLDMLMISHGDIDHVGGAMSVMRAVRVERLASSLAAGEALLGTRDQRGRLPLHQPCVAGQQWRWDGVNFEVLHPTAEHLADRAEWSDNALSCVLRIEAAGRAALLTGDIEAEQEAALVQRVPQRLASEVLLVPHHGSKTSSTDAFLAQVRPQLAVIQVGASNRYGHPHPRVLARYEALGIPVVTTPRCGAWWWRSDDPASQRGHCWRDQVRRYWMGVDELTLAAGDAVGK